MRILLTGATGFLGNNLARALLRQGHEIAVTLRHSSNRQTLDGLALDKIEADLNVASDVAMALNNIDVVVHTSTGCFDPNRLVKTGRQSKNQR